MTWQRTVVRLFPPQTVQLPNDGAAMGIQNMDGGMYFFFKYYDGPIPPLFNLPKQPCAIVATQQANHFDAVRGLLLYPSRVYCFSGVVLTQCCLSSLPPLPLSSTTFQHSSFAVPFEEDRKDPDVWYLDHNYLNTMDTMFRKVDAREYVVGFYSTGPKIR